MQKCQTVAQQILCDEEYYSQEYYINIFKVLMTGTIALQKVKNIWSNINNSLFQESLYAIQGIVIAYFPELQQENPMTWAVQKELATPNVNLYSSQLGKSWSEVKKVLDHNGKPYIPEAL